MHRLRGCNFLEKSGRKPAVELSELHGSSPRPQSHQLQVTGLFYYLLSWLKIIMEAMDGKKRKKFLDLFRKCEILASFFSVKFIVSCPTVPGSRPLISEAMVSKGQYKTFSYLLLHDALKTHLFRQTGQQHKMWYTLSEFCQGGDSNTEFWV